MVSEGGNPVYTGGSYDYENFSSARSIGYLALVAAGRRLHDLRGRQRVAGERLVFGVWRILIVTEPAAAGAAAAAHVHAQAARLRPACPAR